MTDKPTLRAEIEKLMLDIQDTWDNEYHSGRLNERLNNLLFSDLELLTELIEDRVSQELAQVEAEAREEERRRLDKLRQMMWELMPKSSDYGGQELTQSHKEQVKGFQECISIIDYELEALQKEEK